MLCFHCGCSRESISSQYGNYGNNGKYGCIMCMQEGENVNKGSRGNNLKFTYKPKMIARTEEKYLQQAHQSQIHNSRRYKRSNQHTL